ncbi:MAG: hypothetical protein F6K36_22235 [Symploca sp. SIO3C6]|uniref:Uncharacterized protein n=1 Tax=Symploca sp. SIO1C4 TaxID=2607765 RepID=A0A6B3NI00_9CYAN|nr:hypothetical protein [Symploca sp. SIO3C6]NER28948.1 hypothetical protein [Symploca sp. SIO1C4]NET07585.1 hypothetical protein [Symploca sp. SIO2B6]
MNLILRVVLAAVLLGPVTSCSRLPLLGSNQDNNDTAENIPTATEEEASNQVPIQSANVPSTQTPDAKQTTAQAPNSSAAQQSTTTAQGNSSTTQPSSNSNQPIRALW